jgi:hypothetical protein
LSSHPLLLPILRRVLYCHTCLHLSIRLVPGMGRGRTAEDYQRTAEENGWDSDAYEEEDSVQLTKDEPGEVYKLNQQQALDQWIMWVPDSADRACLRTPASGRRRILTRSRDMEASPTGCWTTRPLDTISSVSVLTLDTTENSPFTAYILSPH